VSEQGQKAIHCETCREPELLLWLAAGALDESERTRVEASAGRCPACRARLAEEDALGRVVRSSIPTPSPLSPQALVAVSRKPRDESLLSSLSAADREIVDVLRRVDDDLSAWEKRSPWIERASDALASIIPRPGAGLAAWLRSPAVAYLGVLALAYPAYRGLVVGAAFDERGPAVLTAPLGIDGPSRGDRTPVLSSTDGTDSIVVTVFVPVDERYGYRLEIVDSEGRTRFREDDARSFDAYGTFALMLPRGFLSAGEYELRVDELDENGSPVGEFRFPFRVER
jgi:hypothetical protein